jgi:hypothetical protein
MGPVAQFGPWDCHRENGNCVKDGQPYPLADDELDRIVESIFTSKHAPLSTTLHGTLAAADIPTDPDYAAVFEQAAALDFPMIPLREGLNILGTRLGRADFLRTARWADMNAECSQ